VSFQITILKVLAGQPGGRASLADLRRDVAILISCGTDWTDRTKRLALRAPGLDIFSQLFVLRDETGWLITDAGRTFLGSLESPMQMSAGEEEALEDLSKRSRPPSPMPPFLLSRMNPASLNRSHRDRVPRRGVTGGGAPRSPARAGPVSWR
jgi:hypothetical protein